MAAVSFLHCQSVRHRPDAGYGPCRNACTRDLPAFRYRSRERNDAEARPDVNP